MALSTRQRATEIMHHLVVHDGNSGHGYTWGNRWGNGIDETLTLSDGSHVTIKGGDRDCSSAVIDAWQSAGVNLGGASYTGNMVSCMCSTGNFVEKPLSFIAEPGDLYLNKANHVAMCLRQVPDELMEFSINEFGEVYGGKEGDQTTGESHVGSYYNYPWDCILHYTGSDFLKPSQTPNKDAKAMPTLAYKVKTASAWLPEIRDGVCQAGSGDDFSGEVGQAITGLAIDMSGWYQVCTEASGWLPETRGYEGTGDDSPIIAVRCYYETQDPAVTGWLAIQYEVSDVGKDYWPSLIDTEPQEGEDFAGDMVPMDRFRARLVGV